MTGIPIVNPPPSPTPQPATATPTAQPYVNLVGLTYVINPSTPKSGQPFTVSLVIQNQGPIDAGQFAVAGSFLPGNVYSAQTLPGLPANATTTVNLTATVSGPGTYTVEIVLDLNNQNEDAGTAKSCDRNGQQKSSSARSHWYAIRSAATRLAGKEGHANRRLVGL